MGRIVNLRSVAAAVALSAGFLVVGPTITAGSAAAVPVCGIKHFSASESVITRAGGTTVRLVLTSHYLPICGWSFATNYQFLSSKGATVGPALNVVTSGAVASMPAPASVGDTFQVIEPISTMEGVLCTALEASAVRITSPNGAALVVHLPQSLGVCVNGTTHWTTVARPVFPRPARCAASSLRLSLGQGSGAAGTAYYALVFTNVGSAVCVVSGRPSVQPTTGSLPGDAHVPVGPASNVNTPEPSGYGYPVRLAPHSSVSAYWGESETGNYPPSTCVARDAQSLTVRLSGVGSFWLALKSSTCTKLVSTLVLVFLPSSMTP
jgi:hypothetical protein